MSDYSTDNVQDLGDEVDLDFGGVDPIKGALLLPNGIYVFEVGRASIIATQDGKGKMIKIESVVESRIDGGRSDTSSSGQNFTENWVLPDRVNQTPENYLKTRGFLRGKIEAVTGETWDQDGMKLNVRSLIGCKYKAVVITKDDGKGYGPQNRIQRHMVMNEDHSQIVVPAGTTVARQSQGNGAASAGQPAPTGGRFRI
ncbi:MAG: hypothetical protein ACRD8W_00395 [Nitrososphaeraceae archaeon]